MTDQKRVSDLVNIESFKPFLGVAVSWAVLSLVLVYLRAQVHGHYAQTLLTFVFFWIVCLFSLYALVRLVAILLDLGNESGEKRTLLTIQAFYWAFIKLVCVGILITGLIRASEAEYLGLALVLGSTTYLITPLVGGYLWSRRFRHHA